MVGYLFLDCEGLICRNEKPGKAIDLGEGLDSQLKLGRLKDRTIWMVEFSFSRAV